MIETMMGTMRRPAPIMSLRYVMLRLIQKRKPAAIAPPITGEMTQLAAIIPI